MTTSGTYTWSIARDTAILRALQKINVYGDQETITTLQASNEYNRCTDTLNGMLKMWSIDGIKVSKRQQGFLFPQLLQHKYYLGNNSSSDHCTNSYVATALTANASAGATLLTVTSTTGMNVNDHIGIQLNSGTRQWTTVSNINSSTQVTIAASLTGAASINNTVIDYLSKINRPLEVIYGTTLDLTSTNLSEVEIAPMSHDEYYKLPVKNTVGRPNQFYYDQVKVGTIPFASAFYLYPEPQTVSTIITFVYSDAIQDLSSASDDFDLPQEWFYPIVFNLACEFAYDYGKFTELQQIQPKAQMMYELLKDASSDNTALHFSINNNRV